MKISFDQRNVMVTGAAQGIGREIATQMASAGATLWLCDIDEERLEATRQRCLAEAPNSSVTTAVVDVTSREAVGEFTAGAGDIDVLIHVAGGVCGQRGRPLEEISEKDWRQIFAVNSDSMFWCIQAVTPGMKRIGRGRIVTISSMAGLGVSLTGIQAYAASKAAQISLTRQLAHELGPHGITVNSVAPGFVRSNPSTEKQWEAYGKPGQDALVQGIALRRTGLASDIAPAVLFLASDFSAWTTGQTLVIDGGK
ncbi:SDR family NAD(P)-dependent oxidoreductase [Achromobacter sp. F4_2707]|uniref:SDR family NAD(P)-dependent oxidoreductase n=1 Tax=Achromobacter sp. F4_2707 TaxID=3114286 RepID=UPI0039C5E606